MMPENLTPVLDGQWKIDSTWQPAPNMNVSIETDGEETVFKIVPNSENSAVCHAVHVKPNDHVIIRCKIKTEGTTPRPFAGARFGIDWYADHEGANKRVFGAEYQAEASAGKNLADSNAENEQYVKWGTPEYVTKTWDFIVPATVESDGTGVFVAGQKLVPTAFILWLQIWTWGTTAEVRYPNAAYPAYFIPETYVNPPLPPPTTKTVAARVPMVGNSRVVQFYLRKLRDKLISKELHKRLHPLV